MASLLGLITLATLFLGYEKWRYKQFAFERTALGREMIGVAYKEKETGWIEYLATNKKKSRKPTMAGFRVFQHGDDIRVGNLESKSVGPDEWEASVARLTKRLINHGVKQLGVVVYYEDEAWWKQAMPILKSYGFETFDPHPRRVWIGEGSYWMVNGWHKLK